MSAISQKSISGITSITSPAGTDDQISLHTSNTNEALKIDGAGNLHLNNHVNTTGVTTASNFKTGSSNLHSTGLTVGDTFVHSTGVNGSSMDVDDFISVGSNIHLGNAGVVTATSFIGDGSDLTNLPAGLGTALSAEASSPLNKMYYTNTVLPVTSTITVDTPASASAAYTQYADISVGSGADLIISDGDDLIPDVLGLRPDGTFGGGSLGRMRVDKLVGKDANSAVNVEKGLVITGVTTSTSFVGNLTGNATSADTVDTTSSNNNLTHYLTFVDSSGSQSGETLRTYTNLTVNPNSGALSATSFVGSGANLTSLPAQATIANNADNRVITGGSGVNLNGEAGLTYNGQKLNINTVTAEGSAIKLYNTTSNSQVWYVNGEGNSFIGHTYPRSDANLDLGYHSGYRWRDVVLSGGIRFGSANSDDYLDDYEQGTWTPDWRGASALGTTNYGSYNSASYVKIGNQVTVRGFSELNGSSGGSGLWFINNLPFTNGGGDDRRYRSVGSVMIENYNLNSDVTDVVCFIERNNNDMHLRSNRDSAGAGTNISVNNDTNFEVHFTITYQTT